MAPPPTTTTTTGGNRTGGGEDEGHPRRGDDTALGATKQEAAEAEASVPNPSWTQETTNCTQHGLQHREVSPASLPLLSPCYFSKAPGIWFPFTYNQSSSRKWGAAMDLMQVKCRVGWGGVGGRGEGVGKGGSKWRN